MGRSSLRVRHHASDATGVLGTNMVGGAKTTLTLGRLLGQDMAQVALPRLMRPDPRTLNRLDALFFVFIFGMTRSLPFLI